MSDDKLGVRKARQSDYIFWLQKEDWDPVTASILLAGYEPEGFPDGDINFSSLAGDADGIHRLIIENINAKKISVNNPTSQWIAWATQEGLPLPAELRAVLPGQVDTIEKIPDAKRRLDRLRKLGGDAKLSKGEWKFCEISKLVKLEKSEGKKRSDEKTIRSDLKEAAQAERDAKAAGHFDGLGRR